MEGERQGRGSGGGGRDEGKRGRMERHNGGGSEWQIKAVVAAR